jgi:hypothetical protein
MSSSDRGLDLARASAGAGRLARRVRGGLAALAFGLLASACTVQPIYMPIANGPRVAADLAGRNRGLYLKLYNFGSEQKSVLMQPRYQVLA